MNTWRSYLLAAITASVIYLKGDYYLTALGLGLTVFVFLDFTEKLGKTIPILEVMLLIACLQWILGPYIDYKSTYHHFKYYMYVNEDVYMDLVVPSLILFSIPIYYFSKKIDYLAFLNRIQYIGITPKFAIYMIVTGLVLNLLFPFVPAELGFIVYLLSAMKFIGIIYLFFTNYKYKWVAFAGSFLAQLLASVAGGMFHDLLLWGLLLFIYLCIFYKLSFIQKLTILIVGFWAIFILQTIKGEYRNIIWKEGEHVNKVQVFIDAFVNKSKTFFVPNTQGVQYLDEESEATAASYRLNQGWIISRIMFNIPDNTAFQNGATIRDAILTSLYLSAFAENKVVGGGKETYLKLSGFELTSSTSMGVGIIGEAYGNFGVVGSYWFMLIWGFILGLYLFLLFKKSNDYYTLPLWIPVLFLQVVKAETDFYTVFNHLFKSTILVLAVLYFIRKKYRLAI